MKLWRAEYYQTQHNHMVQVVIKADTLEQAELWVWNRFKDLNPMWWDFWCVEDDTTMLIINDAVNP